MTSWTTKRMKRAVVYAWVIACALFFIAGVLQLILK